MTTSAKPAGGSKPDMHLLAVQEYRVGRELKSRWVRIGAAWKHADGAGFNIRQDFIPAGTDWKLMLREPLPEEGEASQGTGTVISSTAAIPVEGSIDEPGMMTLVPGTGGSPGEMGDSADIKKKSK